MGVERNYAQTVSAEVRAEMARQHKSVSELADILGIKTTSVARARFDGTTPFDLIEIASVAKWLGIDIRQLTAVSAGDAA